MEIKACHTTEFTLSGADQEAVPGTVGHEGMVAEVGRGVTLRRAERYQSEDGWYVPHILLLDCISEGCDLIPAANPSAPSRPMGPKAAGWTFALDESEHWPPPNASL